MVFCGPIIPFTHTRTLLLTPLSLNFQFVCLSYEIKLHSLLWSISMFHVLFSELLSECRPKMHTRSHYSLSSSSHKRYWKVEFGCVWLCRLLSPHRSQVSGSLSSRVKPCRLAQALESQGSGLLLPWEQVPERCCQLFPASSFAVGVGESGHHWSLAQSLSLFSFFSISHSFSLRWHVLIWVFNAPVPICHQFTLPFCHGSCALTYSHTETTLHGSTVLIIDVCVGGCLVSRMLFYGAFVSENKRQTIPSSKRLLLVHHTLQKNNWI